MKKIILSLTTIFILILASNSFAWTLVYSHDSSGNRTSGDLSLLVNAANNGNDIRFMLVGDTSNVIMDAQIVWVQNGIVYAQNKSMVSPEFVGDVLDFKANPYYGFHIVDTNGIVNISRWYISNNTSAGHTQHQFAIKWFIQ